ncbi:uncharacterized protein LOC127138200 [Lathyrus oleraceus]|uniref:uncharacterized protein LOC127138200 n=1 Tax=Pisum sativum TaxID=3888 RepID=UPI0021D21D26|nr:uncharacterized protein LOC127138200 [Pisum sativum]
MIVNATLKVKRRGLTKANNNALSVKDSVILQECPKQTRRNLKGYEAKVARQEFDEENKLLVMIMEEECNNRLHAEENVMVTVREGVQCSEEWYLDSGCSTHMTGRKDWFVKINRAMKNKVKFASDTTLAADGIRDVLII